MPISLNDFKEGGKLRKFVTAIGLLDKIDTDVDQNDLLYKLVKSVKHASVAEDKEKNNWEYDPELDNTEVFEDDEINPKIEEPKKKEEPKKEEPEKEEDLPSVDDIVEEEASWVYVNNEESWNESYINGALKDYYIDHPEEDLEGEGGNATFNDRIYVGTIDGNEERYQATWCEKSQKITNVNDANESYYMKRLDETSEYYGTADEWKSQYVRFHGETWVLYNDEALTQEAGKEFVINSLEFNGFNHTYNAAVNAPGSTLPWVVISIPKGFTGVIKCDYKGEVSYPFGEEQKTFTKGYGVVAKSEIAPTGTFAKTKLKVYLVHAA